VLRASGLDHARVTRPVAAVRFQAKRSNELWQFDMSPSDLKQVEAPLWIEQGRGKPTLMLFSAVDDRSGVVYDEYRCIYGEEAEAALRFLFNAIAKRSPGGKLSEAEPGAQTRGRAAVPGHPGHDLHGQRPGQPLEGVPIGDGQPRRAGAHPHAAVTGRAPDARAVQGQG